MNPTIACDLAFLHVHATHRRDAQGGGGNPHAVPGLPPTIAPGTALARRPRADHICSGASMPSRPRPWASVRAVTSLSAKRLCPQLVARRLEHRTVLVEDREVGRQLEEVRTQPVRAVAGGRLAQRGLVPEQPQRQAPAPAVRRPPSPPLEHSRDRRRHGGTASRSACGRTAGMAPCCRRTTACDPSRRCSRAPDRSTDRRTSTPRRRRRVRSTRRSSAGSSGFLAATAATPRSIASSTTSWSADRVAAAAAQHLAVRAEHVAERDVHRFDRRLQPAGHRADGEHHRPGAGPAVRRPRRPGPPALTRSTRSTTHARSLVAYVNAPALLRTISGKRIAVAVGEPGREHDRALRRTPAASRLRRGARSPSA